MDLQNLLVSGAIWGAIWAAACAALGHYKGRSGLLWAALGFILGIFAFIYLLAVRTDREALTRRQVEEGTARECPHCKDAIPRSATACRSCGRDVEPVRSAADY